MEDVGLETDRPKSHGWKMEDWKMTDHNHNIRKDVTSLLFRRLCYRHRFLQVIARYVYIGYV